MKYWHLQNFSLKSRAALFQQKLFKLLVSNLSGHLNYASPVAILRVEIDPGQFEHCTRCSLVACKSWYSRAIFQWAAEISKQGPQDADYSQHQTKKNGWIIDVRYRCLQKVISVDLVFFLTGFGLNETNETKHYLVTICNGGHERSPSFPRPGVEAEILKNVKDVHRQPQSVHHQPCETCHGCQLSDDCHIVTDTGNLDKDDH